MFKRELRVDVVKKQKGADPQNTITEVLDDITDRDRQEAIKELVKFIGVRIVGWVAITTAISTAAKIAENRLSK